MKVDMDVRILRFDEIEPNKIFLRESLTSFIDSSIPVSLTSFDMNSFFF